MPITGPLGPVTTSTTGWVTPCSVRLPVTSRSPALLATLVLVKVAVGNFAMSKKPALFRSASRAATPVSMVLTPMVAVTVDLVMSAPFKTIVAATSPMRPCTFETDICRMLKSTSLCRWSLVQVVTWEEGCARARGAASARMPVRSVQCFIVEYSFHAGPEGRYGVAGKTQRGERRPGARAIRGNGCLLRAESICK